MAKVVLLNAGRWDWDHVLDFSALSCNGCTLIRHDHTAPEEVVAHAAGADVIITKEMPLTSEQLLQLKGLRLLVEAGTGYNNVDLAAAKEIGATVCNVPAYSSDAVAQLVLRCVRDVYPCIFQPC